MYRKGFQAMAVKWGKSKTYDGFGSNFERGIKIIFQIY